MKTFGQVLLEIGVDPFKIVGAPAWTESLSTMLFDLRDGGLKNVMIPLSPAIMRRIWPKPVRTTVFHLTDIDGLAKLKGLQGGKKSISAFFNIDPSIISSGIKSEGGYVIEMDADILIASQDDISSQPDKTGRRWVTFQSLVNSPTNPMPGLGGGKSLNGMKKDIEKMLWGIIKTHAKYPESDWSIDKAWMELRTERVRDGKIMSLIIRDYLDGMEKVMKKNSRVLGKLLTAYTKKRIQDEDPDSGDKPYWDELVVNKIKIKKVHVSPWNVSDWLEDDDILGFPFELYDDEGDMTDYIDRKIQRVKL